MSGNELPESAIAKVRDRYRNNDATWTAFHLLGRGFGKLGLFFDGHARTRERSHELPGVNTRAYNKTKWTSYDWSDLGEEWTLSEEWRQGVVDEIMLPTFPPDAEVLEIGPGAGRWSVFLQQKARKLTLVDLSRTALDICAGRLDNSETITLIETDGKSLAGVAAKSVDYLWSFDVFVHIAPMDQKAYLEEFARVLRPGAVAVIHHAGQGGSDQGWRASMTADLFVQLATSAGLKIVRQFETFGAQDQFRLPEPGDCVTVLKMAE